MSDEVADQAQIVLDALSEWAEALVGDDRFEAAYAFGSLVDDPTAHFRPGGSNPSDVDLLVVLSKGASISPDSRVEAVTALRVHKHSLELTLLQVLRRERADQAIVSLVPVAQSELEHRIHKSGSPRFYSLATFLDLVTRQKPQLGATTDHVVFARPETEVLQAVQKFRNEYLAVVPNGYSPDLSEGPTGTGSLKRLARMAALLVPDGPSYRVTSGLRHSQALLRDASAPGSPGDHVQHVLAARLMGQPEMPISSVGLLFAWEVLAQDASARLAGVKLVDPSAGEGATEDVEPPAGEDGNGEPEDGNGEPEDDGAAGGPDGDGPRPPQGGGTGGTKPAGVTPGPGGGEGGDNTDSQHENVPGATSAAGGDSFRMLRHAVLAPTDDHWLARRVVGPAFPSTGDLRLLHEILDNVPMEKLQSLMQDLVMGRVWMHDLVYVDVFSSIRNSISWHFDDPILAESANGLLASLQRATSHSELFEPSPNDERLHVRPKYTPWLSPRQRRYALAEIQSAVGDGEVFLKRFVDRVREAIPGVDIVECGHRAVAKWGPRAEL